MDGGFTCSELALRITSGLKGIFKYVHGLYRLLLMFGGQRETVKEDMWKITNDFFRV